MTLNHLMLDMTLLKLFFHCHRVNILNWIKRKNAVITDMLQDCLQNAFKCCCFYLFWKGYLGYFLYKLSFSYNFIFVYSFTFISFTYSFISCTLIWVSSVFSFYYFVIFYCEQYIFLQFLSVPKMYDLNL